MSFMEGMALLLSLTILGTIPAVCVALRERADRAEVVGEDRDADLPVVDPSPDRLPGMLGLDFHVAEPPELVEHLRLLGRRCAGSIPPG